MHTAVEAQETLMRKSLDPGLGLGTSDQLVPFQDSMRGREELKLLT